MKKPIANPWIVLREKLDDWAILFDPDAGKRFGLNPVGALIWKLLDGEHTTKDILYEPREITEPVPDCVEDLVNEFMAGVCPRSACQTGGAGRSSRAASVLWFIALPIRFGACRIDKLREHKIKGHTAPNSSSSQSLHLRCQSEATRLTNSQAQSIRQDAPREAVTLPSAP